MIIIQKFDGSYEYLGNPITLDEAVQSSPVGTIISVLGLFEQYSIQVTGESTFKRMS